MFAAWQEVTLCLCLCSEIVDRITEREKEIEDLLKKVLEDEQRKKEEEEKKEQAKNKPEGEQPAEEVIECTEAPKAEGAPPMQEDGPEEDGEPKKKRANFFARMVNALRKRFGNRRSRA